MGGAVSAVAQAVGIIGTENRESDLRNIINDPDSSEDAKNDARAELAKLEHIDEVQQQMADDQAEREAEG
jgi:hypothetical protein